MPNPRKRKGTRREHASIKWLEAQGYQCTRSGGSLGMWDIVAAHPDLPTLWVQVKSNRMPGAAEMNKLRMFHSYGDEKAVHVWRDRVKEPVVFPL